MPCYLTGSAQGDAELAHQEANQKLTETTALLCNLCKRVEQSDNLSLMTSDVRSWWEIHKLIDQEREEREREAFEKKRLQRAAMSKLTDEEREALDL